MTWYVRKGWESAGVKPTQAGRQWYSKICTHSWNDEWRWQQFNLWNVHVNFHVTVHIHTCRTSTSTNHRTKTTLVKIMLAIYAFSIANHHIQPLFSGLLFSSLLELTRYGGSDVACLCLWNGIQMWLSTKSRWDLKGWSIDPWIYLRCLSYLSISRTKYLTYQYRSGVVSQSWSHAVRHIRKSWRRWT